MDKKYLRQVAAYLLTAVVSVGLMLYICYHLFYGLTQKVETAPALVSTVTRSVDADAFIFRDERPLSSSASGSRVPAVTEGERVGVGSVVSRCYDVSSPDIVERIAGLELQLDMLRRLRESKLSVRDTAAIDADIYDTMQHIAALAQSGSCEGLLSLRAQLGASLNRRAIVTGGSDIASVEAGVRAERDALTAQLGACREELKSPQSGYYYSSCDGFEAAFTASAALNMSPAEFDALASSEPQPLSRADAGKLALSYLWYAACFVDTADARSLTEGESYTVTFSHNGETALPMTLLRLVPDGERTMLVFSCTRLPDGFLFTRSQPVSITAQQYTGLRLPVSALRASDGVTGVYILHGSVVHYRAVRILWESEDYCIVQLSPEEEPPEGYTWLARNDIVITKGRGLREGRVLS